MDLGGGRMRIGLLNPAPDTISLARAVATRGCRIILGGSSHVRRIEAREALWQFKIENSSEILDTPTPTPNSDCRMTAMMTRNGDRKNAAERLGTCVVGTRARRFDSMNVVASSPPAGQAPCLHPARIFANTNAPWTYDVSYAAPTATQNRAAQPSRSKSEKNSSKAFIWFPIADEGTRIGVRSPVAYQASSPSRTRLGGP